MKKTVILLFLFFQLQWLFAQRVEILIKGGHVIDPKNYTDDILDVAIGNGKIIAISKNMDARYAVRVIDASGMYIVPGLVDIHTHVFYGPDPGRFFCMGTESLMPDEFAFSTGVTTVVDAGSSGWRDFPVFKKKIVDRSKTRVLAFLNIVGAGMRGGIYEQNIQDMDGLKTASVARKYQDLIVGIKLAHYRGLEWKPVDEAIKAGNKANVPLMIDFGENSSPMSLRELVLKHMRPGDIFTHCYAQLRGREPIVDTETKQLRPFVWEARDRGIVFDVGYGEHSFSFSQAMPATRAGFYPNSISTDLHKSHKHKLKNILDIMSEFQALGMRIQDIIGAVTWNPAREIRHEELGNLSVGAIADIAILSIVKGQFGFYDHKESGIEGTKRFACVFTIKDGKIVYHEHLNTGNPSLAYSNHNQINLNSCLMN